MWLKCDADWTYQGCWTLISQCRCDTGECSTAGASHSLCWLCMSHINHTISLIKVLFRLLQTLDTRDLKIVSVSANGHAAQFTMGPKHSYKGTPLEITLPSHLSRWLPVLCPHDLPFLNKMQLMCLCLDQSEGSMWSWRWPTRRLRQRRLCSGSHLNRLLGRNIRTCSASVRWLCPLSRSVMAVCSTGLCVTGCQTVKQKFHNISSCPTSEWWRHSTFSKNLNPSWLIRWMVFFRNLFVVRSGQAARWCHHDIKEPVHLWNAPVFTADSALCYVLQAHHCRSMVPCQDSPSVKHTYYAQVTYTHTHTHLLGSSDVTGVGVCFVSQCFVFRCVLSLRCLSLKTWWLWWVQWETDKTRTPRTAAVSSTDSDSRSVVSSSPLYWWCHFQIRSCPFNESLDLWPQVPIPSYLIAIGVGALESRYLTHLFTDVIMRHAAGQQGFCVLIGWQGDRAEVQSLVWERVCG